jgi:hypothetical protein
MPPGEILVTCPHCQHRASIPIAAVKRDNYYCGKCFQKIPMQGVRTHDDMAGPMVAHRARRNPRTSRR